MLEGNEVDSGIPCGDLLSDLVEHTLQDNQRDLPDVRNRIVEQMGPEALVDSAAIIGNFQRMVRIADGTGIPLDKPVAVMSASLRDELGFEKFGSADQTPRVGAIGKWFGRTFGPILMKRMARNRAPAPPS